MYETSIVPYVYGFAAGLFPALVLAVCIVISRGFSYIEDV